MLDTKVTSRTPEDAFHTPIEPGLYLNKYGNPVHVSQTPQGDWMYCDSTSIKTYSPLDNPVSRNLVARIRDPDSLRAFLDHFFPARHIAQSLSLFAEDPRIKELRESAEAAVLEWQRESQEERAKILRQAYFEATEYAVAKQRSQEDTVARDFSRFHG